MAAGAANEMGIGEQRVDRARPGPAGAPHPGRRPHPDVRGTVRAGRARRAGRIGGRDRGGPGRPVPALATGTISTGTFLLGPSWLSRALLAAASAGLVVLGAALTARLVFFCSSVAADIKAPERVFGFFTITAGLDVLGVRLALAGHPLATAILAA